MTINEKGIEKRRLRGSHVTTVFSISLVLLLLGVQAIMLSYTKKVSDYVKEHIGFTVIIKEYTREQDIKELQNMIDLMPFVSSTDYITKDQAAKELQAELGENFIDFLGYNPLLPSIEVHFKSDYLHNDSIAIFEKEITRFHLVKELYYQEDLISFVNENIKKISLYLMAFCAITLLIAILLINNTMRLLIYSKRFNIRTMQLVGARSSFIRSPFIYTGLKQGIAGALLAILLLLIGLWYLGKQFPAIVSFDDVYIISTVFLFLIFVGMFFTMFSTYISVTRYIRMRSHDKIHVG
ncbi:MAG: permease-like cell division protein FtsX [Bacteroidales bacterium]|jgi:cell division transport system permease protein|nr:permease-like cell division protein FtsX [Bacteroidales bacterium]